jgi:hypothetical protein
MLMARWCVVGSCVLITACGRFGVAANNPPADAAILDTDPADSEPEIADLVARYRMDDEIVGGLVPASDAAYDGGCVAEDCPVSIAGQIGGAYAFNGMQRIALSAAASALIGASPFTVSIWIEPVASETATTLVAKPYGALAATDVAALATRNGMRNPTFETTSDGQHFDYLDTPTETDVTVGGWHHVAVSWNGTAKRIYLDGEQVGFAPATFLTSNETLWLGADADAGDPIHYYTGALDDMRIYARALLAEEVATLAHPGAAAAR